MSDWPAGVPRRRELLGEWRESRGRDSSSTAAAGSGRTPCLPNDRPIDQLAHRLDGSHGSSESLSFLVAEATEAYSRLGVALARHRPNAVAAGRLRADTGR
jgi:hypothetical protein